MEGELAAQGVKAKGYRSDASDFKAADELVQSVLEDFGAIDTATEKLNTVFQAASQEMYAQDGAGANQAEGETTADNTENTEAEDVDFEEVDEQ